MLAVTVFMGVSRLKRYLLADCFALTALTRVRADARADWSQSRRRPRMRRIREAKRRQGSPHRGVW
eukprot:3121536-Rhodomonas_salina.1